MKNLSDAQSKRLYRIIRGLATAQDTIGRILLNGLTEDNKDDLETSFAYLHYHTAILIMFKDINSLTEKIQLMDKISQTDEEHIDSYIQKTPEQRRNEFKLIKDE